jgi:predicted Zn finger-like uncharacterized protein
MLFTFECPTCKSKFQVRYIDLAKDPKALKCCHCGDTPAPDIQTAYQNVGKTMADLYGCCKCGDKKTWLPKEIKL